MLYIRQWVTLISRSSMLHLCHLVHEGSQTTDVLWIVMVGVSVKAWGPAVLDAV